MINVHLEIRTLGGNMRVLVKARGQAESPLEQLYQDYIRSGVAQAITAADAEALKRTERAPATETPASESTIIEFKLPKCFTPRPPLFSDFMAEVFAKMRVVKPDAELREKMGQRVRAVWIRWAKEQPDATESWLAPWENLSEELKEVDRRIGEDLTVTAAECAYVVVEECFRDFMARLLAMAKAPRATEDRN